MCDKLPLLLIPGLACTGDLFAPQIAAIQVERPVLVAEHTNHSSFEDLARSILGRAPQRFALAGLSMGGYLSFELLRQAPERIERLALLDTSARADAPQKVADRLQAIELARSGKFEQVQKASLPFLIAEARQGDAELKERILQMAWEVGSDGWVRQMTALMSRPSSVEMLPSIACPTLVLVGDDDRLTPLEVAREMADGIPHASLEVVSDCGHLSSLERPTEVTRILQEWLATK